MKGNAFILFLKYPERGAVKTRIARALGDDWTLALYRCFIADLSGMVRDVMAETVMVYSGPSGVSFSDFPGARKIRQRGSDIGERMHNAFQDVFALGFERAALIGSDIPDLPARLVNDAFEKLTSADVVLGPGTDGGYYLIGCRRDSLRSSMFSGIPWSTDAVLPETRKRIAEAGLAAEQLEAWPDIDEVDDLKQFYQRNRQQTKMSRTMKFLHKAEMIHEP